MPTKRLQGTPFEIGAQVFHDLCMPVLRKAQVDVKATPQQLGQIYAGFLTACYGSMAADFTQSSAVDLGQLMLDSFSQQDLSNVPRPH